MHLLHPRVYINIFQQLELWYSFVQSPFSPLSSLQQPARKIQSLPDLYDASILDLQDGLDRGYFSSVDLVNAYVARINEVNLKGPGLRAVLEINPSALEVASILDEERSHGQKRSEALHGIPILVKDNISTDAEEGTYSQAILLVVSVYVDPLL
jgi:amidase